MVLTAFTDVLTQTAPQWKMQKSGCVVAFISQFLDNVHLVKLSLQNLYHLAYFIYVCRII